MMFREARRRFEVSYFTDLMIACNWRVSTAVRVSGMSIRGLRDALDRLGILKPKTKAENDRIYRQNRIGDSPCA